MKQIPDSMILNAMLPAAHAVARHVKTKMPLRLEAYLRSKLRLAGMSGEMSPRELMALVVVFFVAAAKPSYDYDRRSYG